MYSKEYMIQFSDNLNHHQRCNLNRATGDWRPAARAIGGRRPGRSVAGGPGDRWPAARAIGGRRPGRWVARGTGEGDGSRGGIPGSAGFAQWNQMRDKYRLIGAYGR